VVRAVLGGHMVYATLWAAKQGLAVVAETGLVHLDFFSTMPAFGRFWFVSHGFLDSC
jgi:hypothetical protein